MHDACLLMQSRDARRWIALHPGSHIRGEIDALAVKGVSFVDVTTDWWRTHPGLEQANTAFAKLVRDR